MINLYLIDYYKVQKNNGLNTYVNELANGLMDNPNIKMHFVWVNSLKHKVFAKEFTGNATHLYITNIVSSPTEANAFDLKLVTIVAEDMQRKENLLVHINWIRHCTIEWHLKRKINCKIVLTKHCIPWRDLITSNYKDFYYLDKAFNNQHKLHDFPNIQQEKFDYEYYLHDCFT